MMFSSCLFLRIGCWHTWECLNSIIWYGQGEAGEDHFWQLSLESWNENLEAVAHLLLQVCLGWGMASVAQDTGEKAAPQTEGYPNTLQHLNS